MSLKVLFISVLLIVVNLSCFGQNEVLIKPFSKAEIALLDFISADSTSDQNFTIFKENFRFGVTPLLANGISLLKQKDKIYMQLMGSGRVYEIEKNGKNAYQLLRLDSTRYAGSNFGTINGFYKDTLFQLGGIGFWHIRDNFTFFSKKTHEWEALGSNKRTPVFQGPGNGILFKTEQASGKFYISQLVTQKDFPKSFVTTDIDSCFAFDFNSKTWETLGALNPEIKEIANKCKDLKTDFGPYLVFHQDLELYWLNFSTNQFGTLSAPKQAEFKEKWLKLYKGQPVHLFQFVLGDNFYLVRIEDDGKLLSEKIKITEKDFNKETTKPIYSNSTFVLVLKALRPSWPIIENLLIVFIALFGYRFIAKKIKKKSIPLEMQSILYKNFLSSLTIVEKELIQAIYQCQVKREQISIKAINKIIGVHQKDIITQNKTRSDNFLRINQKFKLATREQEALIVKQREATDKRLYNYNINAVFIGQIEKLNLDNQ